MLRVRRHMWRMWLLCRSSPRSSDLAAPVLRMSGSGVGVGSAIHETGGAFFFVRTLVAVDATALFSLVLSARGVGAKRQGGRPERPGRSVREPRYTATL